MECWCRAGKRLGGLIGPLLMDKKEKVCFLTLVNQVNGPPGVRSRVPNALISEEVDDGNVQGGRAPSDPPSPSMFSPSALILVL